MNKKKILRYILFSILLFLVIAQFFPIDKNNPDSEPALDYLAIQKPPQDIAIMIKAACYDCHSNHTKYPWYTNVAPFSWWIKDHIDHGRKHLNFSEWGSYSAKKAKHKLEECVEFVEETKMPLMSYWVVHPEAKMTEEQRASMVQWFKDKYAEAPGE